MRLDNLIGLMFPLMNRSQWMDHSTTSFPQRHCGSNLPCSASHSDRQQHENDSYDRSKPNGIEADPATTIPLSAFKSELNKRRSDSDE